MKKSLFIFIVLQLSLVHGMERPKQYIPIIKELKTVEKPQQALCINNTTALVLHQNGCSIIDIFKDKELKHLCNHPNPSYSCGIALHPNKTKMAFFYHDSQTSMPEIAIYNLATAQKEWSQKTNTASIVHAVFSPFNESIGFSTSGGTKIYIYNYKTTTDPIIVDIEQKDEDKNDPDCMLHFSPTNPHTMYVGRRRLHEIDLETKKRNTLSNAYGHMYAFNTTKAVKYNNNTLYISDLDQKSSHQTKITYKRDQGYPNIIHAALHPNNAVLTIFDHQYHISFWDISTQTMICSTPLLPPDSHYTSRYLSFPSDGKNFLLTSYGQCITFPVPFEVIYRDLTEKRCIFLYLLLQEYASTHQIPQEIAYLLLTHTLNIHERQAWTGGKHDL